MPDYSKIEEARDNLVKLLNEEGFEDAAQVVQDVVDDALDSGE